MAQAKTLSKAELKQLLDVTNSCSRYAARDATMLLFTHLCGLRIGEVAALRFDDILDANGAVRDEMTLDAARTKSKRARKIFLSKQMQRQLREYVNSLNKQPLHGYLFSTQKPSTLFSKHRYTASTTLVRTCWDCWSNITFGKAHLAYCT